MRLTADGSGNGRIRDGGWCNVNPGAFTMMKRGTILRLKQSGLRLIVTATLNGDLKYDGRITVAVMPDTRHAGDVELINGRFRCAREWRVWESGISQLVDVIGSTAAAHGPCIRHGLAYTRQEKKLLTIFGRTLQKRCVAEYRRCLLRRAAFNTWWRDRLDVVERWPLCTLINEFED